MRSKWTGLAATFLIAMALLMGGAARQDSATVDETTFLSGGILLWKAHPRRLLLDHPPLVQWCAAAPLLGTDVKTSETARGLLDGRLGCTWTAAWSGPILSIRDFVPSGCQPVRQIPIPPHDLVLEWRCPSSYPIDNWYLHPLGENQLFGKLLIFDSGNDGEHLLFLSRLAMIALTILAGLVIVFWARQLAGPEAAAMGAAIWAFNTVSLAYGHLILTDIGETLAFPLAIWCFANYLQKPDRPRAVFLGLATAAAFLMKFSAVVLGPCFVVLALFQKQGIKNRLFWKNLLFMVLSAYALIILAYTPHWGPAPPLPSAQLMELKVPGWFQTLRPWLIPADFFRGLALAIAHASGGHDAYLFGEWRHTGWWYYFPVVFALKTPVPLLILTGLALVRIRRLPFERAVPWIPAAVYWALAMMSSINIGVRHLLPCYVLLAVGIADQIARSSARMRIIAWVCCAAMAIEAFVVFPLFIQHCNLPNGFKYMLDSNYDWGQDAKRLKNYLQQHDIAHIYLDYYGTQPEIEHLKIPNTRVNGESARQLKDGWLVVSASQLMRPEWDWLRNSRQPVERVAHTLFVYRIP